MELHSKGGEIDRDEMCRGSPLELSPPELRASKLIPTSSLTFQSFFPFSATPVHICDCVS